MTNGPGEGADRPPEGLPEDEWGPESRRHGPGRRRPPIVAVMGRAVVPAQPDEVRLALTVKGRAATAEAALSDVATRSEALEHLLGESGVARSQWTTSGVSIEEEQEFRDRRTIRIGFLASNRLIVRLTDPGAVGPLIGEATRRAGAEVAGPLWQVALDNPARTEACRQAVADARRKAGAYAEALGMALGRVLVVSEPGVSLPGPRFARVPVAVAQRLAMAEGGADIDVQPGDLDISAAVQVTFTLVAPGEPAG
jgi:uncharacterized protein YggE